MFADAIRTLRKSRGLTQLDLSLELDVSQQTVAKWERNVANPDNGTMKKLVNFFGVKPEILFGEKPLSDEVFSDSEASLIANYRRLSPVRKKLVRSLVYQLSRDATPDKEETTSPQVVQSNYSNSGGTNIVNVTGQHEP